MQGQSESPKEVNEQQLFEDIFKNMPFAEAKKVILSSINNSESYNSLGNILLNGMKICALNT